MILQELLFPNCETCSDYEMYFKMAGSMPIEATPLDLQRAGVLFNAPVFSRRIHVTPQEQAYYSSQERAYYSSRERSYYSPQERAVHMASWQYLGFDTYFNCFSIAKWRKYTRLNNLKLRLELKGGFHVRLHHMYYMNAIPFANAFAERVCRAAQRTIFEFDIPCEEWDRGMVCFSLESLEEEDNVYYGGRYETEADERTLNDVNIAIDICTFRREAFVERNIALLNREIIENPDSPVCGHLDVFISDNGRTLDVNRLSTDRVHIFPNKNVGGAGGFTRGMIEILDFRSQRPISHVLVMDDDVLINPDALVRTYRLLQFLKPEYAGKTIAGAMLRLDLRFLQHECGGWWDGNAVHPCKNSLDLTRRESLLRIENEDLPNYNAWWFSCIPISKITDENLPLPIFIRYDDVEYGLRTGSDILSINGICLWHEPFEYKYSSSMEYYHMRNSMIVDAFHRPDYDGRAAAKHMMQMVKSNIGRYRYGNCELVFRAVEDFCKGPQFLMETDGETLHREIMAASDKLEPLNRLSVQFDEQKYLDSLKRERIIYKLFRYVTLNRHLLPRRGTSVVDASLNGAKDFAGRWRVLNYDVSGNRGFVTEYSASRMFATLRKARKMARKLKAEYAGASEAYRQAGAKLTSREFWNDYLGLK